MSNIDQIKAIVSKITGIKVFSRKQLDYMLIWADEWELSEDVIVSAYHIMLDRQDKISFPYWNAVLKRLYETRMVSGHEVHKEIDLNKPLTAEQKQMLEALKARSVQPDEDCPELTAEQFSQMVKAGKKTKRGLLFVNKFHKEEYDNLLRRMGADERDTNRAAFAYLVTMDAVCRAHIRELYDFEDGCIHSDALDAAWQTGTSLKTTRLAFNLFTDNVAWTDAPERLSPVELFSCDYAPYYWQAIRIRFPQYTAESEGYR